MSYSSSGAVATLWSPSNYNGATKIPVPNTTRRYSTTSSTSTYRSGGSQERSFYSLATNSYTSSSEYRYKYSTPIRSSTSVPTPYSSRLGDLHDSTSRLTKERSETNDSLLGYTRRLGKTDNDVSSTVEKYVLKSESCRLRGDPMPSRFLNSSNLDSKYSTSRKLCGNSTLELSRLTSLSPTTPSSSSSKPPKSILNSRLQRKESQSKTDNIDSSLSSIRSIEPKISSSTIGGSSSPIETRKTSEVWDKISVSYGESMSKVGLDSDLYEKVENRKFSRLSSRENSDEQDSVIAQIVGNEEKAMTFEEIRKKFDGIDVTALKGGFESSQKSSQDESKASINNGVILGVHNFDKTHYVGRKCKKVSDNFTEESEIESDELESNNSFSSPQTLRRTVLKPTTGAVKNSNSNSVLRKSPDYNGEVGAGFKKKSSPDLKKSSSLSPDRKEGGFANFTKLPAIPATDNEIIGVEKKAIEGSAANVIEAKREARNASITSKLGLEGRSDFKVQPKVKGEKLVTKIEQTLSKQPDLDNEVLNSLSRLRKSPETKAKDFENQTKVIELRRVDTTLSSAFETERGKSAEVKEKSTEKNTESPVRKITEKSASFQKAVKLPTDKGSSRCSSSKEISKLNVKEWDCNQSPQVPVKEMSPGLKAKDSSSPKEEKDSNNARERDLNKKLLIEELAKDLKFIKKEEKESLGIAKDRATWEVSDLSPNRVFHGQPSTSHNSHANSEKVETSTGSSPKPGLGRNRNSFGEKGGLNGLKNIGNTCFMNSVLQCLSNTKPLLEYLLNEDYLTDINFTVSAMKGALIKAFSNVIQELWAPNAEDRIINTINFKSQIQKFAPRFMGYVQQDAQEFLRYLLEGLHEDVNRVTVKPQPILTDIDDSLSDNQKATEAWKRYLRMDDSKVVDIFVGQLKSTLQCTVCGHCSVTFDPFWDLSLPVPSRSGQPRLLSCLDAFTKEEVLDGEEKPTCSKCETRRKCTKSFSIQKFPKILVLHLKRFSSTERYRGKLSVTVDFPLTNLDLSPYAANKGQGCTYNLYAISNHSGTAYGGHYTAYCKHPYTGNWHEYNDSRVSNLSSRSVVSGEAYVLFYELATQTSHL